ncbi:hypothetical protein ACFL1G_09745 [Planctomycetota bacterium]
MKKTRGKKGMYLIHPDKGFGLVEDYKWEAYLKKYPDELIRQIRLKLTERLSGLNEKFNHKSRYFGYWFLNGSDKLYIFVQKKNLCILLDISRHYEGEIRRAGFKIRHWHNFQGKADWLTGWYVPYSKTDVNFVVNRLCKAFEENL